jgi:hypothetical protein
MALPRAPKEWTTRQKVLWRVVTMDLDARGVWREALVEAVHRYVRLVCHAEDVYGQLPGPAFYESVDDKGKAQVSPLLAAYRQAEAQAAAAAADLGLVLPKAAGAATGRAPGRPRGAASAPDAAARQGRTAAPPPVAGAARIMRRVK